jgi:hypothetical protein
VSADLENLIAQARAAGWRLHALGETEEGLWTAELRHPTRTGVFVAATAPCVALAQALTQATRGKTPGPAIPLREPVMAEGLL